MPLLAKSWKVSEFLNDFLVRTDFATGGIIELSLILLALFLIFTTIFCEHGIIWKMGIYPGLEAMNIQLL